jgi:hypothetical protein
LPQSMPDARALWSHALQEHGAKTLASVNPKLRYRINRDNRKRYDVLFVPDFQDTQRRYLQRSGIFLVSKRPPGSKYP